MGVKIERDGCGSYYVRPDGCAGGIWVAGRVVHALIRLGMEAQRERDAKYIGAITSVSLPRPVRQSVVTDLRAQPITDADIAAALAPAIAADIMAAVRGKEE